MGKQVVAIGTSPEIAAHLAGSGAVLSQTPAHSFQSVGDSQDDVGCYLLQWGSTSECERIVTLFQSRNKAHPIAPLYILHSGKADRRLEALSKDPMVAGVYSIPSELFKVEMAVHGAVFPEEAESSKTAAAQEHANPYLPMTKYSVSEVLSRCANAILAAKPEADSAEQKVYFFCESPELLKQAKDAFTRIGTQRVTFFSSAESLLESTTTDAPHQLLLFADAPSKPILTILEKIGLNRKLPMFSIQLLFPGEQSRSHFLRAANAALFDQIAIAALTPKDLRAALEQLKSTHEAQSPRTLLASIRTLINDAGDTKAIEEQLAVLARIPGKERWVARESFFATVTRGGIEASIGAFKKYQKDYPCDLDMWLELKNAAQKHNFGVDQCIEGAIRAITTMGFATEGEHRLLLKTLEDHGAAATIKKYIDARTSEAQQPDTAMKLAFAAYAGAVNDPASELQWVLHLLSQAPLDPGLILRCGKVLAKLGDYDAAARAFGLGAKAAPAKRLIFELKQVESLIGGNRMIKAEEKIQVLQKEFPADPRISRLAQKIGKHFASAGSGTKLMAASE